MSTCRLLPAARRTKSCSLALPPWLGSPQPALCSLAPTYDLPQSVTFLGCLNALRMSASAPSFMLSVSATLCLGNSDHTWVSFSPSAPHPEAFLTPHASLSCSALLFPSKALRTVYIYFII